MKARPSGAGTRAASFRPYTKLELSADKITELFLAKVDEFWKELQAEFGHAFETFPMPVQYALLDMIFKLGRGKDVKQKDGKTRASGLHAFKHLREDLGHRNWKKASEDSHRNGLSQERNNPIRSWFESGADASHIIPQWVA